jgi:sensor histidine kinase YesM
VKEDFEVEGHIASKMVGARTHRPVVVFFLTMAFNTVIALFLTYLGFERDFVINFIFSQCIGLSICVLVIIAHLFFGTLNPLMRMFLFTAALILGSVGGTLLGMTITGVDTSLFFRKNVSFVHGVSMGIIFGSIISYFFYSIQRIYTTERMAEEERIRRITSEKKAVETELRLLQAQIEPHFLFNTLSNILSLLDTDLKKAQTMLVDLIHYLRTSLKKTREDITTIGKEMEMIRAYLNIFRVRMEDRLNYRIDIPDSIKKLPFPPTLVQPLVENAIKHGLEPKIEGGEVSIRAEEDGGVLRLEIADTGVGMYKGGASGLGLSNVRERLKSLYGDKGRLILEENSPSGLRAIIEVPHARG